MKSKSILPNFLIIGAAKSGTTSIYNYLKQHPDVFMSEDKEPFFFSDALRDKKYTLEKYLHLFSSAGNCKIRGESSTIYFYDPNAPKRIKALLGLNVKLLLILRNPAQAMYSMWGQLVKMRLERRDAKTAIVNSFNMQQWDKSRWTELYSYSCNYERHLENYYTYFPKENIKTYIFEDFYSKGMPLYADLCHFLDISDKHTADYKTYNKGYIWKSNLLNDAVWKHYGKYVYPIARHLTTQSFRNRTKDILLNLNRKKLPKIEQTFLAELEEHLNPSVRKLEKLLNRDLSNVWF